MRTTFCWTSQPSWACPTSFTKTVAPFTTLIGMSFSASMMRQVGLNLLAWNYPSFLFRILKDHSGSAAEQDKALSRLFGYTPLTLAAACGRKWNLSPALLAAVENTPANTPLNPLREVCEISDIFGKKQHKSVFPGAAREWEERAGRLGQLIGTENIKEIEERVEHALEQRLREIFNAEPKRFQQMFDLARPGARRRIWVENPYLENLPEDMRDELVRIHETVRAGEGILVSLSALTESAIPNSGFARGVICVQNKWNRSLRLAVRIGLSADDGAELRSLAASAIEAQASMIPVLSEIRFETSAVTRISSSFGSDDARGVLVLELTESAASDPDRNNLAYFKALRRCLEHCLGWESQQA